MCIYIYVCKDKPYMLDILVMNKLLWSASSGYILRIRHAFC